MLAATQHIVCLSSASWERDTVVQYAWFILCEDRPICIDSNVCIYRLDSSQPLPQLRLLNQDSINTRSNLLFGEIVLVK